ncbi:MAG TPA: TonB-dependent receptor [Chitinophagaceae bacterium]|jgi:TonB-linked SusC/RagA family outer membrane protein|nr:TonB-dependent receptor [Chitinophagaceae bacterium]
MRKLSLLFMAVVLTAGQLWAQRTITGKVTDDKGSPVPNASVLVKGTQIGTVSQADGSFSLNVPANAKALVISAVDMEPQELNIGTQATINAILKTSEKSLSEVVVVGYGTQRRKEVTGSVSQINGNKLKDQPLQSFEQGLSGRAAGVNISIPNGVLGNPPMIRVRGTNSISLSSAPLVVIDGIPSFTGDAGGTAANNLLGDINPSDIESIEVLKDASAAAIYGSRASSGVVLITTKKGKQGRARVNYESWAGWTKAYNLIDVLNAQEFTDLKNEALTNAGTPPNGTTRGFYTMTDANGNLIDTRWYDYIYRTGFSHNHTLSVSGANDRTSYYFSTNFTDQKGMFKNNTFKRMTGRFTLDQKVNNWLTVGGTFNYSSSKNNGLNTGSIGGAFATSGAARLAFALAPNVSPYNPDGTYNIASGQIGQGKNLTTLAFPNPVLLLDLNRFESNSERIIGNVYGQVKILNGLNFKTLYGVDHLSVVNEEFRNAIHGDGTQFNGAVQNTLQQPHRWNWQNTLTYDTRFANSHGLNVLIGAEQQYTRTDNWGADRRNQTDPFFDEFQGGFIEIVPAGNTFAENFLQSYFGRINYDFKKRYFLSFNARRDGYSAFAEKWGTFYGGSVGWTISEEDFWKNSNIAANTWSSLKLRGSYGMVGNFAGIASYPYQTLFTGGLYGSVGSIFFNQGGNPDLTWEKSKKLDIGFSTGILKDRFTLEFAYYKNDISDLVLAEPQSPSRGIPGNSILRNVGSMVNKGIEITLNGNILQRKDFSWSSSFNITTLKNEVTALSNNNADILVSTGGLESPSLIRVGESIGSFLAVKTTGINPANGQRIFLMKNGTEVQYNHAASSATRWTKVSDGLATTPPNQVTDGIVIGPALPKYFGGFDNTFRYKGFDLNFLLFFSGGNYVYNGSKAGLHDNRNWNNAKDNLDRWQKAGDVTEWPRVVFGDNVSNGSALVISSNVEKGDFLKVRNVSLGYTIPQNLVGKVKLSNVRVFVAALNLLTFTKYSGFDPETQSNGESVANQVTNGAPGVDRNAAPLARTINVGVNIGF